MPFDGFSCAEEAGGLNLHAFCGNDSVNQIDVDGLAYFAVRRLSALPSMIKWSQIAMLMALVHNFPVDTGFLKFFDTIDFQALFFQGNPGSGGLS